MIRRMSNVLLNPVVCVFALLSIATALFAFNFDALAETCWDETTNGACEATNVPVFTCAGDSTAVKLIGNCECQYTSGTPDYPPGGQPGGTGTHEIVNSTISAVFQITDGYSTTDDGVWIPCQMVYNCECNEDESGCIMKCSEDEEENVECDLAWASSTKALSKRVTGNLDCPDGC